MTRNNGSPMDLVGQSVFQDGKLELTNLELLWQYVGKDKAIKLAIGEDGKILENFSLSKSGQPLKTVFKGIPFDKKGLVVLRQDEGLSREDRLIFFELQPAWLLLMTKVQERFSFYVIRQSLQGKSLFAEELGPLPASQIKKFNVQEATEKTLQSIEELDAKEDLERVIAAFGYGHERDINPKELASLILTAGGRLVATAEQRINSPDSRFYLGSGKIAEIKDLVEEYNGDLVVFDNPLTPVQQRNIQEILNVPVIDRNQLILDIFAANAKTKEGQVQVELAQLSYLLPRLVGHRPELSRLGGGIGTRGPGETKLETDRRRIRRRILELKKDLEQIKKQRQTMQKNRELPLIALIGYTNSGKSTLLNSLTGANTETADKLFATLDPITRRCRLLDGRWVLVTDTVGFIKGIPHDLIAAFRATLEGVEQADLLLHVVDVTQPRFDEQIETVLEVLQELNTSEKPIITVFNKIDLYPDQKILNSLVARYQPAVLISAYEKENLNELLSLASISLGKEMEIASLNIPYGQGKLLEILHSNALVIGEDYRQEGIHVRVFIESKLLQELKGQFNF